MCRDFCDFVARVAEERGKRWRGSRSFDIYDEKLARVVSSYNDQNYFFNLVHLKPSLHLAPWLISTRPMLKELRNTRIQQQNSYYRSSPARNLISVLALMRRNLRTSSPSSIPSVHIYVSSRHAHLYSHLDILLICVWQDQTHIDIIEDFDLSLIDRLTALSKKHDFLIFEDRKFADIGGSFRHSTVAIEILIVTCHPGHVVALQFNAGVHKIASWSHITDANPLPGPSVIAGLASVGAPLGRGLLLLAQMSTAGQIARGTYTEDVVRIARAQDDFVIGFIAQRRMGGVGLRDGENENSRDFLTLTPGVGLESTGDSMGQQYRTPREVILESGSDVIIVGRGVCGDPENIDVPKVQELAERYRQEGWDAYLERVKS